jgi:hypothetical protein
MKLQDFYDFMVREEAYDASSLNCFAFRHGYDVRQGLSLSLGNMVRGFGFDLQGIHFHNSECAYIAVTQHRRCHLGREHHQGQVEQYRDLGLPKLGIGQQATEP